MRTGRMHGRMQDRYQTYFLVPPDAFRIAAQTLPRSEFASLATRYFVGSRKKKRGQSDGAFSGDSSTCQLYTVFCAPTRLYRVVGKSDVFFDGCVGFYTDLCLGLCLK